MWFMMENDDIKKHFIFVYSECHPKTRINNYRLYSINKNIDKYFQYAKYFPTNGAYYDDEISNMHLPDNLIFETAEQFNHLYTKLFFEFPDDYPEEDLFYFVMKFNVKEFKNIC